MWKVLFSCFLQSSCQQEYCTCFARKVASSQCPKVFNYSKIIVLLLKLLVNIYWHGDKLNAEAKTCDLFSPSWLYSTRPARPHCPKSNPRYNTKCSGENEILRGIFCVVSCFPLHFALYVLMYSALPKGSGRPCPSTETMVNSPSILLPAFFPETPWFPVFPEWSQADPRPIGSVPGYQKYSCTSW